MHAADGMGPVKFYHIVADCQFPTCRFALKPRSDHKWNPGARTVRFAFKLRSDHKWNPGARSVRFALKLRSDHKWNPGAVSGGLQKQRGWPPDSGPAPAHPGRGQWPGRRKSAYPRIPQILRS